MGTGPCAVSRESKAESRPSCPSQCRLSRLPIGETTQIGGEERGFDGGKLIKGRKRFILVDTLGLLLTVKVVAGSVSEKEGSKNLLEKIYKSSGL